MCRNLIGWTVKAYLLSGIVAQGSCVGDVDKFIILVDGIVTDAEGESDEFKAILVHKNRVITLSATKKVKVTPIESLYTLFKDQPVKFVLVRGGYGEGTFKSIVDRYVVLTNSSVYIGDYVTEENVPVCNIHKNQIEIMYTRRT